MATTQAAGAPAGSRLGCGLAGACGAGLLSRSLAESSLKLNLKASLRASLSLRLPRLVGSEEPEPAGGPFKFKFPGRPGPAGIQLEVNLETW